MRRIKLISIIVVVFCIGFRIILLSYQFYSVAVQNDIIYSSFRNGDFFDYLGEQCGGNHAIFEGIVKILTTIGRNYKTEGMKWISTAIAKNPTMTLANSSALTYLEFVMMPYVFGNKIQIRRTPELLRQVRTILNFMVEKSSVTGFVLRDMVS